MNDNTALNEEKGLRQRFLQVLGIPWVDKSIAIVAIIPFVYEMNERFQTGGLSIPRVIVAIHLLVVIATMMLRKVPVRVTPNPWYWLLAFVATYFGLFAIAIAEKATPAVARVFTDLLAILSLCVLLYARFSLGRSIGFVPAERVIVTSGAYRFVRHPIYTGTFLAYLAFVLRSYSLRNVALVTFVCGLFIVKSFIEERFLSANAEYAEYLRRVPWRWIPGIL